MMAPPSFSVGFVLVAWSGASYLVGLAAPRAQMDASTRAAALDLVGCALAATGASGDEVVQAADVFLARVPQAERGPDAAALSLLQKGVLRCAPHP